MTPTPAHSPTFQHLVTALTASYQDVFCDIPSLQTLTRHVHQSLTVSDQDERAAVLRLYAVLWATSQDIYPPWFVTHHTQAEKSTGPLVCDITATLRVLHMVISTSRIYRVMTTSSCEVWLHDVEMQKDHAELLRLLTQGSHLVLYFVVKTPAPAALWGVMCDALYNAYTLALWGYDQGLTSLLEPMGDLYATIAHVTDMMQSTGLSVQEAYQTAYFLLQECLKKDLLLKKFFEAQPPMTSWWTKVFTKVQELFAKPCKINPGHVWQKTIADMDGPMLWILAESCHDRIQQTVVDSQIIFDRLMCDFLMFCEILSVLCFVDIKSSLNQKKVQGYLMALMHNRSLWHFITPLIFDDTGWCNKEALKSLLALAAKQKLCLALMTVINPSLAHSAAVVADFTVISDMAHVHEQIADKLLEGVLPLSHKNRWLHILLTLSSFCILSLRELVGLCPSGWIQTMTPCLQHIKDRLQACQAFLNTPLFVNHTHERHLVSALLKELSVWLVEK